MTSAGVPAQELLWYAIRVRSNFEQVVSAALRGKGYEEFLPAYRRRQRWSDRIKEIDAPLFPGYTFCRFDPNHRLPVLTTPGVVSIVGTSQYPLPVAEAELDAVRAILASHQLVGPWPFLREGEWVTVERGPLAGLEGVLVKFKTQYRLVVSISLLQRSISAEVDRDCVRPIVRPVSTPPSPGARPPTRP